MAKVTRRIGLSLGADICWPICYQEVMKKLDLHLRIGTDEVNFEVERLHIDPFDLRQPCPYDLVIDRLTHWYHTTREWIKKAVILDDLYVFNNPWSLQSMEKQTTYSAMIRLGLPVPATWLMPPKEYEPSADLEVTLERYARMFDLGEVGRSLGYPMYMKPYDGGAWRGVSRIEDESALRAAYEESGKLVMHLQRSVEPYEVFARCIGLGPDTHIVNYDPSAAPHDRYTLSAGFLDPADAVLLRDMTLTINAFFGWDFNSCEALLKESVWYPIDFANACPDSQVTSLHYHFPWLIRANIRWSVFCAATRRLPTRNLDWGTYFRARDEDLSLHDQLAVYAAIANQHLDTDRFVDFCDEHLSHLDDVLLEFFASPVAEDAVRAKVEALFPVDEVDEFTQMFWDRIQQWREDQSANPKAREEKS